MLVYGIVHAYAKRERRQTREIRAAAVCGVCVSQSEKVCVCGEAMLMRCASFDVPTAIATTTTTKAHTDTLPRYPTPRTGFFPAEQKKPHRRSRNFESSFRNLDPIFPLPGRGTQSQNYLTRARANSSRFNRIWKDKYNPK
jgi:hypothetical protein